MDCIDCRHNAELYMAGIKGIDSFPFLLVLGGCRPSEEWASSTSHRSVLFFISSRLPLSYFSVSGVA